MALVVTKDIETSGVEKFLLEINQELEDNTELYPNWHLRMLEVKTIGKPCAGEPHARFDEEARVTCCYSGFTLFFTVNRRQNPKGVTYFRDGRNPSKK